METYNILENWKKSFYVKTSILAIKKHKIINRESVDFIYSCFLDFFGPDYFSLNKIKFTRITDQKLVLDRNPMYQLLIRDTDNAFYTLLDMAALLTFSKRLDERIYTKLISLRDDIYGLRNYLFEIFVYRLFMGNRVSLHPKPTINNQELEGIFSYQNKFGAIECKKLYSTEINRFSHLQDTFNLFFKRWMKYQPEIFAFILAPNKEENALSQEKELIKKLLSEYYKEAIEKQTSNFIFERFHNGKKILHIENNKPGIFENLRVTIKEPHAFFSVAAPAIIRQNDFNFFHFYNGYYFAFYEDDIQDKIKAEIKKKRRQLKGIPIDYRIFFFENESAYFGEFPLVPEKMLNSDIIYKHIYSKNTNDLIVFIDKNFFPNQDATAKMYVYCKPELNSLKDELEKFDLMLFKC